MGRTAIILRGVSGSGKSSLAETLPWARVSADDYFETAEGYRFDGAKLKDAHARCLRTFVGWATGGWGSVVVDNTNTRLTEVAPYAAIAEAYGLDVLIVTVRCPTYIAHARNRHGVPIEVVEQQARQLDANPTPDWWKGVIVDGQAPRFDAVFREGSAWLDADDVNYCIGCAKQIRGEAVCDPCRNRIEGR